MSGREEGRDVDLSAAGEAGPPEARVEESPWKGWVWSVPIAAAILIGYLVLRTLMTGGTSITVSFPSAEGITGNAETPVRYRGLEVGTVQGVDLDKDMGGVVMHLSMNGDVSDALRSGTRFWIVQPSPMSGNFSSLLAGPHLAMQPGPGEPTRHFRGLLEPPPEEAPGPGTTVIAHAPRADGVSRGAPVMFRGVNVGRVLGATLDSAASEVRVRVFVRSPYDKRLGRNARFWSCGGLQLSTAGGGLGVHMPSFQGLLQGCVAFDTFATAAAEAGSDTLFRLYASSDAAHHAFIGAPVPVEIRAPGSVAGLQAGAPVELEGERVGRVRDVGLVVGRGGVSAPVTLELDPARFGLSSSGSSGDSAKTLYRLLDRLVRRGLRAQVVSAGLVLGGEKVSLVMTHAASSARLDVSRRPPLLPTIGGGSIQSIIAEIGQVAASIDSIPFGAIGRDLRKTSPEVARSIRRLDSALVNLDSLTAEARAQLGPGLIQMREAMTQLHAAARGLSGITGGSFRNQESVADLVKELTGAARSLRELSDYLSEHPEALIWGRSGHP